MRRPTVLVSRYRGEDTAFALFDGDLSKGGILAGPGNANPAGGLEDRPMVRAHQTVFFVGQEAVGGEIQRPALVGADVEPGSRPARLPGDDQPLGIAVALNPQFAVLAFGQVFGRAQEHWFTHGV